MNFISIRMIFSLTLSLILVLALCSGHTTSLRQKPDISQCLAQIPKSDLDSLRDFFELFVKDYDMAYTLFGDKPCSIACYKETLLFKNSQVNSALTAFTLEEGWRVWLKYQYLFPSTHFVLKKIDSDLGIGSYNTLIIINKLATRKLLKEHLDLFHKTFSIDANATQSLNRMCEDTSLLAQMNKKSEILGLLLGYGRNNAYSFKRKFDLCLSIKGMLAAPIKEMPKGLSQSSLILVNAYMKSHHQLKNVLPLNLSALVNEINDLTANLASFELPGSDFLLEWIQSPIFSSIKESLETNNLYRHYVNSREKVLQAYMGKPILEVTLNQWINDEEL